MSEGVPTPGGPGFAYRPALDGLRAVAVLAVIAYHLGYGWARGGFLGVDAFFVISGYLITSLLLREHDGRGGIAFRAFWARRARRLLPALFLVLFAVSVYAAVAVPSDELHQLRIDGLATLAYVANWRFIASGQSYFSLFTAPSPLRHMWSLAIEEQFYLVWPLVVFACLRVARGRVRVLAGVATAGVVASVVLMALRYDAADPSRAYYGTDTRAHSLLVGALLALLLARWTPRPGVARRTVEVLGVAATGAVLWAFVRVGDHQSSMYHGGFLVFSVAVAVLVAAAVQQDGSGPLRRVLSWHPLRWVGTISYGLYIWHWPVIVVMTRGRTGLDGSALDVARVATTFGVASASYYLVERRVRYGTIPARRLLAGIPAAAVVVAIALVASTTGATTNPLAVAVPITAPPVAPTTTVPGGGTPRTVVVVGGSVATTLSWGLEAVTRGTNVSIVSVAFPGCGVAAGLALDDQGHPFSWSRVCEENAPKVQTRVVAEHDPDIVVWLSTWELQPRQGAHGTVLWPGTPAHDRALRAAMEAARRRLTARGAHLVMILLTPFAASDTAPAVSDSDGRFAHYNALIRRFAADHPRSVSVVDPNPLLCPSGPPCPTRVDGLRLRPDGRHFTEQTATWVARHLLPEILAAGAPAGTQPIRSPSGGRAPGGP